MPPHPLCEAKATAAKTVEAWEQGICIAIETAGPDGQPRDLRSGSPPPPVYLDQSVGDAGILLLGEVHDNPVHHRLRANWLVRLGGGVWRKSSKEGGRLPPHAGIILEHVRLDKQTSIDTLFSAPDRTRPIEAGDVFDTLEWEKSGWPERKTFQPIIRSLLDLQFPIYAGNPPREELRNVARGGIAALPDTKVKQFELTVPLPAAAQDTLLEELEASHCGLMPKEAFSGMADAQRYRDAFMARALLSAQTRHGHAILLAGNGHVRRDRGVPWHLKRMAPAMKFISVVYVEVDPERTKLEDYVERDAAGAPIADFVFVTTGVERPDPCEAMRKRYRR